MQVIKLIKKIIKYLAIWLGGIRTAHNRVGDSNKVSQHHNSVGGHNAAGDVNANTYTKIVNITQLFITVKDYQEIIDSGISPHSPIQNAKEKVKYEYEAILNGEDHMLNDEYTKHIMQAAAVLVKKHEFGKAHRLFEEALGNPNAKHYDLIFKQYLITGFIYYCQENNMRGLGSLLERDVLASKDPELALITANISQEICSRDTDLERLQKIVPSLETLYGEAPASTKSSMANSLGLAYRRLGERTGVELLQKAIPFFTAGLEANTSNVVMEIELKDQMAITYVRIFEFNKDANALIQAEKLLSDCVELFEFITDPRDYRLKPRVLNNLGNVHKQKTLISGKKKSVDDALSCYEEAEKYWDEKSAKYEWALLQKNKGETKYALAKVTRDSNLLLEALMDCLSSVKYRTLDNSPYQWGKSVDVLFQIVICLDNLNNLRLIPKRVGKEIISFAEEVFKDNSRWTAKNFVSFISNAKKVQALLQQ